MKDVASGYSFPAVSHAATATQCGATPVIPAALPPPLPPTTTFDDTRSTTLKELYTSEYSLYELIGTLPNQYYYT